MKFSKTLWMGSLGVAGFCLLLMGCGKGSAKRVYFGNLEDGSNVESPFKVQMKAENLIVEPATMGVTEGHGHFHIIIDAPLASPSEPMAKDEKHMHFGKGETEATLNLPVGQHTLILQFAKGDHVPYDPPVYQQVQVNVTKQNAAPADTGKAAKDTSMANMPGMAKDTTKAKDTTQAAAKDTAKAAPKDTAAAKPAAAPAKAHKGKKKK